MLEKLFLYDQEAFPDPSVDKICTGALLLYVVTTRANARAMAASYRPLCAIALAAGRDFWLFAGLAFKPRLNMFDSDMLTVAEGDADDRRVCATAVVLCTCCDDYGTRNRGTLCRHDAFSGGSDIRN